MPAPPRWLLAIPDAIRQLAALDREVLTRRDVEQLFGVSRARAATLMQTFGAETDRLPENAAPRTTAPPPAPDGTAPGPPSAAKANAGSPGRHRDCGRRGSPGSGSRFQREALEARLSEPARGRVGRARDRIEVRFSGAQDAVARLFALAQALTHDYEQFEALVGRGEVSE